MAKTTMRCIRSSVKSNITLNEGTVMAASITHEHETTRAPAHRHKLARCPVAGTQTGQSMENPRYARASATPKTEVPRVVVIGGGWAGYAVAESLSTNNTPSRAVEIILLDASKGGGGGLAGGYRDSKARPFEAGIHGFWREYRNTFDVMESIEGVDIDAVLSGYTPSVLYSKNGRVALAPVLGSDQNEDRDAFEIDVPQFPQDFWNEDKIRRLIASNLPPPLDLPILAQFDEKSITASTCGNPARLRPIDLLSGLGLLGAWADFEQESPSSWKNYDSQPASLLFEKAGITSKLFEELVSPLLHVLPMCPAYDCSAAACLSCFHVFALQSKGAFDVRWCRGSIGEKIFDPWRHQLEQRGVKFRSGTKVACIKKNSSDQEEASSGHTLRRYNLQLDLMEGDSGDSIIKCDAVVLAVGAVAAGKLASSSPALSSLPSTTNFDQLRGVTCVAVRLFLKPHQIVSENLSGGCYNKTQLPPEMANAMKDSPVAVCGAGIGRISELNETGFCIYDLQRMHDEFNVDFYTNNGVARDDQMAVLEVDFYRADSFVDWDDDKIVQLSLKAISAALNTVCIDTHDIIDSKVLRARKAVSHFAPSSALLSPGTKLEKGMYIAGDWVDRTGHASWSTEKSVVTARQAASALSRDFGLKHSSCQVVPAAKDTPQLSALRRSARVLRAVSPPETLPPSPWVLAKQLMSGMKEP
ncbi:hypothetical protein HJC23_001532 [Cyclotella cryptica]|uniref:Amine oxidase domain-containing protein n=1 Tax=Cyclotella cryptica TaxID=29204 RepID=A0ABD3PW75_9STRA